MGLSGPDQPLLLWWSDRPAPAIQIQFSVLFTPSHFHLVCIPQVPEQEFPTGVREATELLQGKTASLSYKEWIDKLKEWVDKEGKY